MSSTIQGQATPADFLGNVANLRFAILSEIAKTCGMTLVRVISCTNAGSVAPFGFVDVQPLVNQLDGAGNPTPHGPLHNLIYFRVQGGTSAIILDPVAGDIGVALFADRDISNVIATQAQSNPGSLRRYDMSDGVYFGGTLNAAPTQFIQFAAEGVTICAPTVTVQGNLVVTGDATINGRDFMTHQYNGVQTGSGDTGAVV